MSFKNLIFILVVGVFTSHNLWAASPDQVYQEEYVFLKNQLESLKKRRQETKISLSRTKENLEKSVYTLEQNLSSLESKSEILKTKLSHFAEDQASEEQSSKKIEVVLSQMDDFLSKRGVKAQDFKEKQQKFLDFLRQGSSQYYFTGSVYNQRGEEISGEIYNIGHVFSYFKTKKGFVPLASHPETSKLFFTSEALPNLNQEGLTLVNLKEGAIREKESFLSVVQAKLKAGGAVGYVIIFLGFLGIFVALIRYSLIQSYSDYNEEDVRKIVNDIQSGHVDAAKKHLYDLKVTPLNHFLDILISSRNRSDEAYESLVMDEIMKIQNKVSKYGPYLLILAAVAPLLGLLGTVTGMIGTFDMITLYGTGNPKLLSGGIKEALVTTQMGLIVAIPAILVGNYLSSKALKTVSRFEEVATIIPKESSNKKVKNDELSI